MERFFSVLNLSFFFVRIQCCCQAERFPSLSKMQPGVQWKSGSEDDGGSGEEEWIVDNQMKKRLWRCYDRCG